MHESGLCQGVLSVVRDVSAEAPVARIRLRVGRLQGVVPDIFEFCWRMVAEDTAAGEARLELIAVPGDSLTVEEVELTSGEVLRNPHLTALGEKA